MPAEMRTTEIRAQAASTYYLSRLNGTIPLDDVVAQGLLRLAPRPYDTLCVSIALVSPSNLSAFNAAQAKGDDGRASSPSSSRRPLERQGRRVRLLRALELARTRAFAPTPGTTRSTRFRRRSQVINYNGGQYALFVAPTKRTPTPFAQAASAVFSDSRR